jgi:hypothetical protein
VSPGRKRRGIFSGKSLKTRGENFRPARKKNADSCVFGGTFLGIDHTEPDKTTLEAIVKLAVESWRFFRVFEHAVSALDAEEAARYHGSADAFRRKIEEALATVDMRMVGIEGTAFDPGIAATPLNIEDFGSDDELEVDAMAEPIIMRRGELVRMGSVTLRKTKHEELRRN